TPIFYLNIVAESCTAEVRLNDAPMFTWLREDPARGRPTVSEWVIAGENWLTVQIVEVDLDARLRVALCQAKLGDVPVPGQEIELAVIEWPDPLQPGIAVELPLVLNAAAMATHPWGRWWWQDSPPFAVDARTTSAVIDYVRDLH